MTFNAPQELSRRLNLLSEEGVIIDLVHKSTISILSGRNKRSVTFGGQRRESPEEGDCADLSERLPLECADRGGGEDLGGAEVDHAGQVGRPPRALRRHAFAQHDEAAAHGRGVAAVLRKEEDSRARVRLGRIS